MEINKEYKLLAKFTADLSNLLQHNVVTVSGRLLERGLVTKDVHDSMLTTEGVSSQKNAARLMSCVLDRVKYSSRCFHDFISVLREDAYYEDVMVKIIEAHTLLQSSSAPPTSEDPAPSSPPPSSVVRTVAEPSSSVNVNVVIERLDKQYIEIEKLVFKAIKRQKVPLEDMLDWIRFLPIGLKIQLTELVQTRPKLLVNVSSIDELFLILSPYWNLLHPDLLGYLVDQLEDTDLKARMDRYMEDLHHFRIQTTLGDFLDKWVGEIPSGYQEFVLELGEEWRKKTVEDFEQFRIRLSRLQSFGGGHMSFMKTAKSSSTIIILALPTHLFPLNLRQKAIHNFFRDENIMRMMVDGQYVYDSKQLADCERELLKLCADEHSDVTRIKYLLNRPAVDPNFYDEEGRSLLWWACYHGQTNVVTLLLDSGADVNLPIDEELGETPLICASSHGYVSVCEVLLERGATVDFQTKQGLTALYLASQFGQKKVVELLLDSGASVDKENMDSGFTALRIASVEGHTEVAGVLIARGAVVDYQDKEKTTALYMASQVGWKDVVELLLDSGASVDKEDDSGSTALRVASAKGRTEVAGVLIARGAVVDYQDKQGATALYLASQFGWKDVVELLLDSGASVDKENTNSATPLIVAGQHGSIDVCQLLIQQGADVNHQDTEGWSPLHYASSHGHPSIVELFIKSGAQLDVQSKDGMTALAWAAYDGHTQIVHILLNAGASPDIQSQNGLTALMLATQRGHKEVIQSLLEKKANPNITDKTTGRSAIFFAVEDGNVKITKILVEGGADVDLKDKNDLTALDTAKLNNQEDVYQLLEKHSRSGAGKDITEEQRQQATTFTKRLRKIFGNLEWMFLRGRVLKQVEQTSREFPSPGSTELRHKGKKGKKRTVISEPQSAGRSLVE